MARVSQKVRAKIAKALKLGDSDAVETDEFNSILLQITMAVMLIFMIAFFIFMNKVGGELNRIDAMKQALTQAEKERLLRIVEEVAERYRIRYGLKAFLLTDPVSGEKSYVFSDVIRHGRLVSAAGPARLSFLSGAAAAHLDYGNEDALLAAWLRLVADKAGAVTIRDQGWLRSQVADTIREIRREVVEVQTLAAAAVQEHFLRHPESVRDPAIRQLLTRMDADPASPDRQNRMEELSRLLKRYVYAELERQCGTPMLKEVSR